MLGFGIKIQVKDTLSKKHTININNFPICNASWNKLGPHTISILEWRLYNDWLATIGNILKRGFNQLEYCLCVNKCVFNGSAQDLVFLLFSLEGFDESSWVVGFVVFYQIIDLYMQNNLFFWWREINEWTIIDMVTLLSFFFFFTLKIFSWTKVWQ